MVYKFHEHDFLLEITNEPDLSEKEKADAWAKYESEAKARGSIYFSMHNFKLIALIGNKTRNSAPTKRVIKEIELLIINFVAFFSIVSDDLANAISAQIGGVSDVGMAHRLDLVNAIGQGVLSLPQPSVSKPSLPLEYNKLRLPSHNSMTIPPKAASVHNQDGSYLSSTKRATTTLTRSKNWFDDLSRVSSAASTSSSLGQVQSINAQQNPMKDLSIPNLMLRHGPQMPSTPISVILKSPTSTNATGVTAISTDATISTANNKSPQSKNANNVMKSPADFQSKSPAVSGSQAVSGSPDISGSPPNITNIVHSEKPSGKNTLTKPSIANVYHTLPKKDHTPSVAGAKLAPSPTLKIAQNQLPVLIKPLANPLVVGRKVSIDRNGNLTLLNKQPAQNTNNGPKTTPVPTITLLNQSQPPLNVITPQQFRAMQARTITQGTPAMTTYVQATPQKNDSLPQFKIIKGNGPDRVVLVQQKPMIAQANQPLPNPRTASSMGSLQTSPVKLGNTKIQPIINKKFGGMSIYKNVTPGSPGGLPASPKRADLPIPMETNGAVHTNILDMLSGTSVSITRVERPKVTNAISTVNVVSRHRS